MTMVHAIAATTTALALALIGPGVARAQPCPRLPAGLLCAPLPEEEGARRELLQALDLDGRDAVSRGDYPIAVAAFGCLVEVDPTPESAGNLAVVLREQGALGDALLIARCAEQLAVPGPTRDRARVRRLDIERRLGLPALGAAADLTASGDPGAEPRAPPGAPSRVRRTWGYAALALGVTVLIGSGLLYALARQRARQFDDEQLAHGYSDRARGLRDETQTLEIGGWIGAGAGVASMVGGGALLRF
jgi:hypothetical protein